MLLSAYLFLVILSFFFWLTTPEKAEALEIKEENNFFQQEDSEPIEHVNLSQEDEEFSQFYIPIEKIQEIISNLKFRDARTVAKKVGIKQRIGRKNRTKAELVEKILEKFETEKIILIQSLNELTLLTSN
jgi:hypothetical protein